MNVHLTTLGCRLNEAELQSWAREFSEAGQSVVGTAAQADLIVLNTCAVTAEATRKSAKLARRLHRVSPQARLVITGCYAALSPERVAAEAGVDLVLSNSDKDRLVPAVLEHFDVPVMPRLAQEPDSAHVFAQRRTRAFVKVQDGCRNRCTFCVVTLARGDERSRPVDAVVEEVAALTAAGAGEVILTGVHLGGYGSDLGTDLRSLVEAVLARTDVPRVRIGSLEPWDLPDGFFELWSDPRLCPHLHLPLQSGCESVLRRMARRNTASEFAALVAAGRERVPELNVTTDLMVGFPGETDAEHEESMAFVRAVGFGHVHIFAYSSRVGTKAAGLPGQLARQVKRDRSAQAHTVAGELEAAYLRRYVGTSRPVLWEGRRGGAWLGHTDNYLRVEASAVDAVDWSNRISSPRLEASSIDGTLVASAVSPR